MAEWTVDTLKTYIDTVLKNQEDAIERAFNSSDKSIHKVEDRLNDMLIGFPQDYSRKAEYDRLRDELNAIKADHVQRREFEELKTVQAQSRGAKIAMAGCLGIILTLISITLGAMYNNQLTPNDVSNQIDKESRWRQEKPEFEKRIQTLEQQIIVLNYTAELREVSPYR